MNVTIHSPTQSQKDEVVGVSEQLPATDMSEEVVTLPDSDEFVSK